MEDDDVADGSESAEHLLELAFVAMRFAAKHGPALDASSGDPIVRAFILQTHTVWRALSGVQQTEVLAGRRPW